MATPRVRTAVKAYIPHVDDHVSKLQSVGVMTQNKLQNIADAATAAGIYDLQPLHNTVSTGECCGCCCFAPSQGVEFCD